MERTSPTTWRIPEDLDPLYDAAQQAVAEVSEGVPPWLITVAVNTALAVLDAENGEPVSRYRCSGCSKPEFEHPFAACAGAEWLPINNDTDAWVAAKNSNSQPTGEEG